MDLAEICTGLEKYVIGQRRWFHEHPELSLQEMGTTEHIRQELEAMGIPCQVMPSGCGVLGTIEGGKPGKRVGIRADIDALPITEENDVPYKSQNPGVMHACGHDGHTSMLLGVAKALNTMRDELPGTVKVIFQPAEEVGKGTEELIATLEKEGGLDGVFGLHVSDSLECGTIGLKYGSTASGSIAFHVDVLGQGGHGSMPWTTRDPIRTVCDLIPQLESIPSNYYDARDFCTVTVGLLQGGRKRNVIPDTAMFEGTIRFYDPNCHDTLWNLVERICDGVGRIHGVNVQVQEVGGCPPVANDDRMITLARSVMDTIPGLTVADSFGMTGSDNVDQFTSRWPGFYAQLGVRKPGAAARHVHTSTFNLDEDALVKGVTFLTETARAFLEKGI